MAEDSRAARSEATRRKIVQVAERLFAERGIEGVSLNDINKAAGQRNKNATHYHFGSKEGLLQAILDKHEPEIAAAREGILDELEARGDFSLREVVEAMVWPLADKLRDPDGGRYFLRFSAQLVVPHTLDAMQVAKSGFQFGSVQRLADMMNRGAMMVPAPVSIHRGILVGVTLVHGLAEHARLLTAQGITNGDALTDVFVTNLVDCLTAMLSTPLSSATERKLAAASSA